MGRDLFSARFVRAFNFSQGYHRFRTRSDDGVRVWLDGQVILDDWRDAESRTYVVGRMVDAGIHEVWVDYYDAAGLAYIDFNLDFVSNTPTWEATYFNNPNLADSPIVRQFEPDMVRPLDYIWETSSPIIGRVPIDNWSARWQGTFYFDRGTYIFHANVDDGIRVFVDDIVIIDEWTDGLKDLENIFHGIGEGNHTIRVEYYEHTGSGRVQVWWFRNPNAGFYQ